jgi:integrase
MAEKNFKEVAVALINRKEGAWRNEKHRQQWRNTLATYVYPHFGDLPVSQIDTSHVLGVLEPIWSAKAETASRVRGRIENVLDAAKVQGLRTGENAARWRGHLEHILPKPGTLTRGHHPSLPYAETPAFMAELKGRGAVAARALEFTILTVARSGSVLRATWGEVDLVKAEWIIPAEHMKAEKGHSVPLSPRAVEILSEVHPLNTKVSNDAPLFPSSTGRKLSGMAMPMLLRRMDRHDITVHGFRSTFREWAGECSSFPREVVEHAMAHQLPDKAEAAYQRGTLLPKRVKLMEAWAAYCTSSAR